MDESVYRRDESAGGKRTYDQRRNAEQRFHRSALGSFSGHFPFPLARKLSFRSAPEQSLQHPKNGYHVKRDIDCKWSVKMKASGIHHE